MCTMPGIEEVVLLEEIEDMEIPCDISGLRMDVHGLPNCQGDPARWIAFRTTGCCGKSPMYRLVCAFCKKTYQNWMARQAFITCMYCGAYVGGFTHFEPLKRKA